MSFDTRNICLEFELCPLERTSSLKEDDDEIVFNIYRHDKKHTYVRMICPLTESCVGVVDCYSCSWNSLPHEGLMTDIHIDIQMREIEL